MPVTGHWSAVQTRTVAWYLSSKLDDHETLAFAESTGGAVLRGRAGHKAGCRLRKSGFAGRLWLDPATYERPDEARQLSFSGDEWSERQRELDVAELISPGSWVPAEDADELARSVDREAKWVTDVGGDRLSLAVHGWWLQHGIEELVTTISAAGIPVAIAFGDRYDPLRSARAVDGFVALVSALADVAVLRCDIGALGAVAHGAALGAFGTSSTVRHVFPPGERGFGPQTRSPSVFVPTLLAFKLGETLDEWPREASPTCHLACCEGRALRRFNDPQTRAAASTHNRIAICGVVDHVLAQPSERRAVTFRSLCQDAIVAYAEMSGRARRRLAAPAQLKAWARAASTTS